MAHLSQSERFELGRLRLDRSLRNGAGWLRHSPLLRWRHGRPHADRFHIAPPDIRATDTSFTAELAQGAFGLAGTVVDIGRGSPFAVSPPSEAWARELHGFAWLRDVQANNSLEDLVSETMVRQMVSDWIERHPTTGGGIAWDVPVLARRILSWMMNAGLLLDGADATEAAAITQSLGQQIVRLSASWRQARDGEPRLLALVALMQAGLCLDGHVAVLQKSEAAFRRELRHQILPDGGHRSRNTAVLVELLLDFLPLKQSFLAIGRPVPPELNTAIGNMLGMVGRMQHGDGTLARFNGVGRSRAEDVATVLAYDEPMGDQSRHFADTGYVRLQNNGTVVIADVAGPPPLAIAALATASALAFEMSVGSLPLFVSCGAPGPADEDWRGLSRSTASHCALTVAGASSSKLLRHDVLSKLVGGEPIAGPSMVKVEAIETDPVARLSARHDGFRERFGVDHQREFILEADGQRLIGIDQLAAVSDGGVGVAFAIHFHLHPDVRCELAPEGNRVNLTLPDGQRWRLVSDSGLVLAVEESTFLADAMGPRPSLQAVLRGRTGASGARDTEVRWIVERLDGELPATPETLVGHEG